MRTIAELSRITGIDYNTVKYYTKPATNEAKGAGLITYSERRGGKNYYDDKALIDLMLIGLMRKCDSSHAEIRHALDTYELEEAFERQEKVLKRKIRELNRSLRTADLVRRFIKACAEGDDDQMATVSEEYVYLWLEYASDSLGMLEATKGLSYKDEEARALYKRLEEAQSRIRAMELRVARGVAAEEDLKEELDKLKAAAVSACSKHGLSLEEPPKSTMELWEEGAGPTDPRVQECIGWMYKLFSFGVRGFTPELFGEFAGKLIKGNELAVLMELAMGEGFSEFQQEALDAFIQMKKEEG